MSDKLNIFIPAAGLGERLRPITDYIPKPLVPLSGRPALQLVLENISKLPFDMIAMNLHHKMKAIEQWVALSPFEKRIKLFREHELLDTGGGLQNAREFLGKGTFLVHNSDILSDMDLQELVDYHRSTNNLATLAVHDFPEFNNVLIDEHGLFQGISRSETDRRRTAFTGIAVYEPAFIHFLPEGRSSVVTAWYEAAGAGQRIGTFDVSGCYWTDIGTPSSYAAAVFFALRNEGETVYVHRSVKTCRNVAVQGHVVIEERAEPGRDVSLKNCIVLPETVLSSHQSPGRGGHEESVYANCIIGPDFRIDLSESKILPFDEGGRQLIGSGGSDRKYFRVRKDHETAVLMQSVSTDPDFTRHIEYSRFFINNAVPVPRLIEYEADMNQALFEDAGDISLYSYLKFPLKESEVLNVYKEVIDALTQIHTKASENVSECPLLQSRRFDHTQFRWESAYFIEWFIRSIRNISGGITPALENEFAALALRADSAPKTVIHRDFQSQNIMIMPKKEIRIIDYQGARIGPPAYDVSSILWDPYYQLEADMREFLLDYYLDQIRMKTPDTFDARAFHDSLPACRIQRHLQALGAYGFLSSVKGKKFFLKYVPEGLRLLKEDIVESEDVYPELYRLITKL